MVDTLQLTPMLDTTIAHLSRLKQKYDCGREEAWRVRLDIFDLITVLDSGAYIQEVTKVSPP